jgi:hypothetical protein
LTAAYEHRVHDKTWHARFRSRPTWLRKNAIIAAFDIESATSIYSGPLRMFDLLSMQSNRSIPLYLVAPDERRTNVLAQVNRPTFSRLSPPLKA